MVCEGFTGEAQFSTWAASLAKVRNWLTRPAKPMTTTHLIPSDISQLYEVHEWRNAAGVLFTAHVDEWNEVMEALRRPGSQKRAS